MALTFLNAVNESLKRAKLIQGDQGELSSFTDASIQPEIDRMKQVWNDAINYIYSIPGSDLPTGGATTNITLVTGQREYTLPADLEAVKWPLINQSNGSWIKEYPGGYEQMRVDQLQPSQWTGQPYFACISPVSGKIRMDRAPSANENGDVYVLDYDKRHSLSATSDTFPFSDTVVEAMVAPVVEIFKRYQNNSFDSTMFSTFIGSALRLMPKQKEHDRW